MGRSELLVRETLTDEVVDFGTDSVRGSSADAPWREFVRIEQQGRHAFEVDHTLVLDTIVIYRQSGILQQCVEGGPLRRVVIEPGDIHIYGSGISFHARTTQNTEYVAIQLAPKLLSAIAILDRGHFLTPVFLQISTNRVAASRRVRRASLRVNCRLSHVPLRQSRECA